MLKKIEASNLFLIGALVLIAIGGSQFYQAEIKPRFSKGV